MENMFLLKVNTSSASALITLKKRTKLLTQFYFKQFEDSIESIPNNFLNFAAP